MNTPDISHPHANHKELFNKAFDLAERNLFSKQINNEALERLYELDTKQNTEARSERNIIIAKNTGLYDIHADSSAIEIFENLETALGKRLVQQISKINKRCILIIGDADSALVKGIASYAYYSHTNKVADKSFYYIGCLGLDENDIDDWLKQETLDKYPCVEDMPYEEYKKMRRTADKPKESAILKYKSGSTLFMRGLESTKIFKRLTGIIQDEKSGGLLIVSTPNKDSVPIEFIGLCETIYLETPQKQGKANAVIHFPLPPLAKVIDIKMDFLDEQTVRITIQDESKVFNFAQMGFLNGKSGKPNKLWDQLLIYVGGNGITDQKDSERINDTLQAFFKTEQKLLNRNETFFKISKQTISNNKITQQGKERECPSCHERHKSFCKVCKEDTEHCQECHDELYKNTHTDLAK